MAEAAEREGVGAGSSRARRQAIGGGLAFGVITIDGNVAIVIDSVGAVFAWRIGRGWAACIKDAVAVIAIDQAVAVVVGEIAAAGLETERPATATAASRREVAVEVEAVDVEVAIVVDTIRAVCLEAAATAAGWVEVAVEVEAVDIKVAVIIDTVGAVGLEATAT